MHLVIPFVATFEDVSARTSPQLDRLLASWAVVARDDADELHPALPHERLLARALGWRTDAPLPWAARQAAADGVAVAEQAWGLLSPAHWQLSAQAVHLADPAMLALDEAASRAYLEVLRPWFQDEGFTVAWGAPLRWYVAHESLAGLSTASLDRVIGRNVDQWLLKQPEARLIRRLQDETQMLLHEHPLNLAREAQGLPAVNSFWLSGCGVWQPEAAHDLHIDDRLRGPALAQDAAAWQAAWATLDAEIARGGFEQLTLCGERSAVTLAPKPQTWWKRWTTDKTRLAELLKTL